MGGSHENSCTLLGYLNHSLQQQQEEEEGGLGGGTSSEEGGSSSRGEGQQQEEEDYSSEEGGVGQDYDLGIDDASADNALELGGSGQPLLSFHDNIQTMLLILNDRAAARELIARGAAFEPGGRNPLRDGEEELRDLPRDEPHWMEEAGDQQYQQYGEGGDQQYQHYDDEGEEQQFEDAREDSEDSCGEKAGGWAQQDGEEKLDARNVQLDGRRREVSSRRGGK